MKKITVILFAYSVCSSFAFAANEIGYLEKFSLAGDRSEALKLLIPGTDDYYYYHMLHYQNEGNKAKFQDVLDLWKKRNNGHTPSRAQELINRQALIDYPQNNQASLDHINRTLNLRFNHERRVEGKKSTLPTKLDTKVIATNTLVAQGLAEKRNLGRLTDPGLRLVADKALSADQRRNLLSRLKRPDYPGLVKLVNDDLAYKHSKGFGSFHIHRHMTREQLDALVKLRPKLRNEQQFVNTYLTKLRPSADVNLDVDVAEHRAYLQRIQDFVETLDPVHNSLKAITLYRRLDLERNQGVYDAGLFMQYIKLPRSMHYVNPDWLKTPANKNYHANLGMNFQQLGRVGNDESLVRSYLATFFVKAKNIDAYRPYIRDTFLKRVFAATKIEQGIGNVEQWASMLSPSEYKSLKERIDIHLAPENQRYYAPATPVELQVDIKNVKTLLVKVFEINTFNYYRSQQREINLAVNLDGLVASTEKRHNYTEAPERRVRRTFKFPELKKRGVYVVEFIGNGQSSRALVTKGRLHYLVQNTAAGHRFTILNQANQKTNKANIWLGGRNFTPGKDGSILIPYSTNPRTEHIIIREGDFASFGKFQHQAENYYLNAGLYVDREALLKGAKATVLVKPTLLVSGVPTAVELLENVKLTIDTTTIKGVKSQKVVDDFKLFQDRESEYTFSVPDELGRVQFTLQGDVQNISRNKKESLRSVQQFQLNGIERTQAVDDMHITHPNGEYFLEFTGKTGELRSGQVVKFEFKNRFYQSTIHRSLQTDDSGRIALGTLRDIEWFKYKAPNGSTHTWRPQGSPYSLPTELQGVAGQPLVLPLWLAGHDDPVQDLSLLEVRSGTFVADHHPAISWKDGLLTLDDLPAGDYNLRIRSLNREIPVRLTGGKLQHAFATSATRKLEASPTHPVHFKGADFAADGVRLQLGHATKFTRVHVYASRYEPTYRVFDQLGYTGVPSKLQMPVLPPQSFFVSGRNIGDEYRYILERKLHKKYPGNMLERPGLLLNPWAVRDTDAGTENLARGGEYDKKAEASMRAPAAPEAKMGGAASLGTYSNLDYLETPAVSLLNLVPDKNGAVVIPAKELGDKTQLMVTIVDPQSAQTIQLSLSDTPLANRDLRLLVNLDPEKHLTEQKLVSVAPQGKPFAIADVTTSTYEGYDSLGQAYQLLVTLSNNSTLREFAFIADWPGLSEEDKQAKYSKYASHELSFFIYHKDRKFFDAVIAPYLKNKKDKTFMDHWLLGNDLTAYLDTWAFSRLNIVERILLGKRIAKHHPALERHVRELNELIPADITRDNMRFDTATALGDLDGDGVYAGFADKASKAASVQAEMGFAGAVVAGKPAARRELRSLKLADMEKEIEELDAVDESVVDFKKQSNKNLAAKRSMTEKAGLGYYKRLSSERSSGRRFFQKLDATKEWAENNYYHLRIEQQLAGLVSANGFWADYAAHQGKGAFLSSELPAASRNFAEMMMALAVLDLPFKPGEHTVKTAGVRFEITPRSDMLVFHKEIRESALAEDRPPILVSQHFFRLDDRYRHEGNERYDKYVNDEFLRHVVYGGQVIVTNPSSNPQKLSLLLQIPKGALPVNTGFYTKGHHIELGAYNTQTIEYMFYFPATGKFPHYPVHVARNQELIAFTDPVTFNVVEKLSKVDKTSWAWVSQNGSTEDVLTFLDENNIERLKLDDIAWRVQDKAVFEKTIGLLQKRHKYHQTLWMYAMKHNKPAVAREFLQHTSFANQCGMYIDTDLLSLNPVDRHVYQHLEYAPLVNARAHRVGKEPTILNHRFRGQYQAYMRYLSYKATLDSTDRLAATYYLALQDRVEEALQWFSSVNRDEVSSRLQFDYMQAYLGMYEAQVEQARAIATRYKEHPVPRWRKNFLNILGQLDDTGKAVDPEDRAQAQEQLAAREPALDFTVEARKIAFKYQNVKTCTLNFYPMDIELLFSRNPFIQDQSAQFSFIRPVLTRVVELPADQDTFSYELPRQFHSANVMVEVTAAGLTRTQAYYANSINLQLVENYGQLRVSHLESGDPLDTVYVKVYARNRDGSVKFFKDGYTDFRGRFDYVSLNTNEIDNADRLSLLILSDTHGAMIKEAAPPKR